jgi:hypothetical protein
VFARGALGCLLLVLIVAVPVTLGAGTDGTIRPELRLGGKNAVSAKGSLPVTSPYRSSACPQAGLPSSLTDRGSHHHDRT